MKTCQIYFDSCFLALTQETFLLAVIVAISYVISDGLVPYVQELLSHFEENGNPFPLLFDEMVIAAWLVRVWSAC